MNEAIAQKLTQGAETWKMSSSSIIQHFLSYPLIVIFSFSRKRSLVSWESWFNLFLFCLVLFPPAPQSLELFGTHRFHHSYLLSSPTQYTSCQWCWLQVFWMLRSAESAEISTKPSLPHQDSCRCCRPEDKSPWGQSHVPPEGFSSNTNLSGAGNRALLFSFYFQLKSWTVLLLKYCLNTASWMH